MLSKLFLSFAKINLVGFGGGNALIPVIHKEFVEKLEIINDEEFIDIIAISNSLPGPSVTQMAHVIGYKADGWKGSIAAVSGTVFPIAIIFTIIMKLLFDWVDVDFLTQISSPVLVVISAVMTSLSIKFFKQLKGDLKPIYSILLVAFMSYLLIFVGIESYILIVAMIILVMVFTR